MNKLRKLIKSLLNLLFIVVDFMVPKNKNYWIFPVYFIGDGSFSDNMLAIFEKVKSNPGIKKIILTKRKKITIENGMNVEIQRMSSLRAIWLLMRARIIFIQHSVWLDLSSARYQIIYPWRRHIVNLWHGIVIKDLSHPSTGIINFRSKIEMGKYKIICSSEDDKVIMQKSFYKTDPNNFWITGLPRNDFLKMKENELPEPYKKELAFLRNKLGGKKLIIYTPTYRETNLGGMYYPFSTGEISELKKLLLKSNAVLGLRYHTYLPPAFINEMIDDEFIIDLSTEIIADVRMLIREASLIITDYSSVYIDAMYLNKKLISFAYDLDHYLNVQRGFYYDFKSVFPGRICYTFIDLINAIGHNAEGKEMVEQSKYQEIYKLFFAFSDTNNSQRVIDHVHFTIGANN